MNHDWKGPHVGWTYESEDYLMANFRNTWNQERNTLLATFSKEKDGRWKCMKIEKVKNALAYATMK